MEKKKLETKMQIIDTIAAAQWCYTPEDLFAMVTEVLEIEVKEWNFKR